MLYEIELSEGVNVTALELTKMLKSEEIQVVGFYDHKKATERYVVAVYSFAEQSKTWTIPFYYRRTNVRTDTIEGIANLLVWAKTFLRPEYVADYKIDIGMKLKVWFGNAIVTIPIFEKLLANCGEWVWNKNFDSPNPQRRIQDIKETGFTLATKIEGRNTYHMLLPFPRVEAPTYETFGKIRR